MLTFASCKPQGLRRSLSRLKALLKAKVDVGPHWADHTGVSTSLRMVPRRALALPKASSIPAPSCPASTPHEERKTPEARVSTQVVAGEVLGMCFLGRAQLEPLKSGALERLSGNFTVGFGNHSVTKEKSTMACPRREGAGL